MKRLSGDQVALLREAVARHRSEALDIVEALQKRELEADEREQIIEALVAELVTSGVGNDWEPNARGHVIEGLISVIQGGA